MKANDVASNLATRAKSQLLYACPWCVRILVRAGSRQRKAIKCLWTDFGKLAFLEEETV